jgi:hypothetical protein
MTRYLMTIGEAVDLVIVAATVSATEHYDVSHGIYMLDMGEPVSILTVAENMIRLAGKRPYQDIEIVITGRRPGEKLHETLCAPGEQMLDVGTPNIFGLRTRISDWEEVQAVLDALGAALRNGDKQRARGIMEEFCSFENGLGPSEPAKGPEVGQRGANGLSTSDLVNVPPDVSDDLAQAPSKPALFTGNGMGLPHQSPVIDLNGSSGPERHGEALKPSAHRVGKTGS